MNEERKKILDMLASGKITVEQADKLLAAVGESELDAGNSIDTSNQKKLKSRMPKFLRIQVNSAPKDGKKAENINIKIPIGLLKAGMKLGSIMPESAKTKVNGKLGERGINLDLNNLDKESIGDIIKGLEDMTIDVNDSDGEQIRIFTE